MGPDTHTVVQCGTRKYVTQALPLHPSLSLNDPVLGQRLRSLRLMPCPVSWSTCPSAAVHFQRVGALPDELGSRPAPALACFPQTLT